MPLKPISQRRRTHTLATLFAWLLLFSLLAAAAPGAAQKTKKGGRKPSAQTTAGNDNAGQSRPASKKRVIVPGRASDTAQGSRISLQGDGDLNDYEARQSGDRFIVKLPNADASRIKKGGGGRGYSDMQVQQQGNDVVLSYRLKPGAKPRVDQRFNRLDVVFDTPEGSTETRAGSGETGRTTPPSPAATTDNRAATDNRSAAATRDATSQQPRPTATVEGGTTAERHTAGSSQHAEPSGTSAAPDTASAPVSVPEPLPTELPPLAQTPTPVASQSAAPLVAQEQRPVPAGPVTATSQQPSAQTGVSLGTFILRNWPVALTLMLLLVGVGLFFAARRSSAKSPGPLAPEEESEVAAIKQRRRKKPALQTPARTDAPAAAVPATQAPEPAPVAAGAASTGLVVEEEAKSSEEGAALEESAAVAVEELAAEPDEEETTLIVAPVAERTQRVAPAVTSDPERVAEETRRLLGGEDYDREVVAAADPVARQMVGAELLSALSGRNEERRARARAAFVEHGFFDDAASDLQHAQAPAERASAARALALVGDTAATPHLVAALNDRTVEVRRAAVEALAALRDPRAVGPLRDLLKKHDKKHKSKVPRKLVQHAIEVCEAGPAPAAPVPATEAAAVAADETAVEEPPATQEIAAVTDESIADVEAPPTPAEEISAPTGEEVAAPVEVVAPPVEEEAAPAAESLAPSVEEAFAPTVEEELTPAQTAPAADEEETLVAEREEDFEEVTAPFAGTTTVGEVEAPPVVSETAWAEEDFAPVEEATAPLETPAAPPAVEEETTAELQTFETSFRFDETAQSAAPQAVEEESESATPTTAEADEPARAQEAAGGWFELDVDEMSGARAVEPYAPASEAHAADEAPALFADAGAGDAQIEPWQPEPPPVAPVVSSFDEGFAEAVAPGADEGEKAVEPIGEDLSTVPKAIQLRLTSEEPEERVKAITELSRLDTEDSFQHICAGFDDPSERVRAAAARSLYDVSHDRAESFTRALREAEPERRRHIGAAIASSGLAGEAISQLTGESRDKTYDAFSLLFLMAKAGEVQPLVRAIEMHPDNEVRLAVVKLLALSGQKDVLPAFRRLAVRGSLPTEVRSAVMEAIYQISSQSPSNTSSVA